MSKHFFWHINYECNQNCLYCHTPPKKNKNLSYNINEWKKRIKDFKKNGVTVLKISGGEPTLHKDIIELINYSKKNSIKRVELVTNGIKLNNIKFVEKLKTAGLDMVNVSFPSHLEKVFNNIRGTNENAFAKTIKGIYNCFRNDIEVSLVHVVCKNNYKKLPHFVEAINSNLKKISFLNFALISPKGRSLDNKNIVPNYSLLKPYLAEALKRCKKYNIFFDVSSIVPLCLVENFEEYISSTRFLLKNHVLIDDGKKEIKVKNLRKINFNKLENETAIKAPQCKNCSLDSICVGFFPGYAKIWGYDFFKPSKKSILKIKEKTRISIVE